LGGWSNITNAQAALLRRAVTLITELERREGLFMQAGCIDDTALAIFVTATNALRRVLETLGLERKMRDVTPSLAEVLKKLDEQPAPPAEGGGQ
jgi:hypothetical protein